MRQAVNVGIGVGVMAMVGFGVLAFASTMFGSKDKEQETKQMKK